MIPNTKALSEQSEMWIGEWMKKRENRDEMGMPAINLASIT